MINRKVAPPIVEAVNYKLRLKPYHKYNLDNGVPVYSIHAGEQEVMQVELVYYAGNSYEDKIQVAASTNFMLKNGTKKRTALQINEAFEYYGAYCNRACYSETAVVSLHTLSKHIKHLLPIMTDMVQNSIFPEDELEIFKKNSQQKLMVSLQKADFVANRMIDAYLFGEDHPYGKYSDVKDLKALNTQDLKAFYKKYYLKGKLAIFVSGNLPSDIEPLLNEAFGKLTVKPADYKVDIVKTNPAKKKKHVIHNDKNAVQGAIRLAAPFPNRHHPDFKKSIVLNTIFGGYFGSRLMRNIREEKGYTYGIHSYLQNHIQQSAWMISTEAGIDVCKATIDEVYKEMKILRDKKIKEDELNLVRNYMVGGILGDLDGPFQIMAKWKNIILNDTDEKYFYDSVKAIKETTAEELQELARTYLQPELFYELQVF